MEKVAVVLEDGRAKMSIHGDQLASQFLDKYCKQFDGVQIEGLPLASIKLPNNDVPRIGSEWAEQGGIYGGTVRGENGAPDHHLILHAEEKASIQWQPAMDWAKTLEAAGHNDFSLPTRREQAILYGNLKDQFKEEWYWSCAQRASYPGYAWFQYFHYGYQYWSLKDYYGRARAVRRVIIQ